MITEIIKQIDALYRNVIINIPVILKVFVGNTEYRIEVREKPG